ncbi:methyltransferase domain-containing protein [Streptomyces sp. NPDC059578]|uniref:methyltransferase domain-containing protein n=1 Tax=Streptomyces sp. NPDC059578 TaxID=3346874 RepID=UPI0036AE19BB
MTNSYTSAADFTRALTDQLVCQGAIRISEWDQAFAAVPRHLFVPRWYEQSTDDRGIAVWNERDHTDPHGPWLEAVYSDTTLVTALDPATAVRVGPRAWTGVATSSSTQPSLMAGMLEELRVDDGHHILEIGTGTGYNTALLCARLGDQLVRSIDIDPALVDAARKHLALAGFTPALAVGDGRDAYPGSRLLFDRIIATCSVPRLPEAWITQTRPGGLILTDLDLGIAGGLVRFHPHHDGTVQGHFTTTTGAFMPARDHPRIYDQTNDRPQRLPASHHRPTTVTADAIRETYPFRLLLAFALPRAELVYHCDDNGFWSIQLQTADGAWARVPLGEAASQVAEGGDGRLWRTVENTWAWWNQHGRPEPDAFTVIRADDGRMHARHLPTSQVWDLGA